MTKRGCLTDKLTKLHTDTYGAKPAFIVSASGRVNIIGEHIDYNGGKVLPFAVKEGHYLGFSSAKDTRVYSEGFGFYRPEVEASWSVYIAETLQYMEKEYGIAPVSISICSDLPSGVGMSSSSALVVGLLRGLFAHNDINYTDTVLVETASRIEHGAGVRGGMMDQTAIVHGEKGKAILYDTAMNTISKVSIPEAMNWFVVDSGTKHDLRTSPYNAIRERCDAITRMLESKYQCPFLAHADTEQIYSLGLSDMDERRALHVLSEQKRTEQSVAALKADDAETMGSILSESHWSLSTDYVVSTPIMDDLVSRLQNHPEVLGCRMMGGGFGGSIIGLIRTPHTEILSPILDRYTHDTGHKSGVFSVEPSSGSRILSVR